MKIIYHPKFKKEYKKLPTKIKNLACKKEEIFRVNNFDHRLNTHKLHGGLADFWSFSVNYKYRIIFEFIDNDTVRFYAIGNHDIYE